MNNNETNPLREEINFKALRLKARVTLRDVERETGISNAYLSQLENGHIKGPSYKTVTTLLEYYRQFDLQSQSLPAVEQPEKDIAQLFDNNSDCYADTWEADYTTTPISYNDGPIIPAMTKEKFIEVVSQFKQPSQPESLTKMLSIAPPEKWLKMYEYYQELLVKEDVSGFWQDNFYLADKERNEVKDISNNLAESYAKLQIEYGKKCAELNELKIDGHESKTLEYIKQFISDWMSGHEPDTFIANKHGNYIYSNGPSSLNLKILFEDLLVYYMDANHPRNEGELSDEVFYNGELNVKRIGSYKKLHEQYNIEEGTVRDIFSQGIAFACQNYPTPPQK